MTIADHRTKVFRGSALALFVWIPAASSLSLPVTNLVPEASASPPERPSRPSAESVAVHLDRPRASSDDSTDRLATIEARLARKRAHLAALRVRLADARALTDERARRERVSQIAYQAFYVESRIAAEEDKRRDVEARQALSVEAGAPRDGAPAKELLEASRKARRQTATRLLQRASHYGALITEARFKDRLDRLVSAIQSERERQS